MGLVSPSLETGEIADCPRSSHFLQFMFQTKELREVILRAGNKEREAEPRGQAAEGERAMAAMAALAPVPQNNYPPLH